MAMKNKKVMENTTPFLEIYSKEDGRLVLHLSQNLSASQIRKALLGMLFRIEEGAELIDTDYNRNNKGMKLR